MNKEPVLVRRSIKERSHQHTNLKDPLSTPVSNARSVIRGAPESALPLSHSRADMSVVPLTTVPLQLTLRCHPLAVIVLVVHLSVRLDWSRLLGLGNTEPLMQEDLVHVLQTPPCGLREEEIRDWDEARIENSPDDVKLVSKVLDGDRCDIDDNGVG